MHNTLSRVSNMGFADGARRELQNLLWYFTTREGIIGDYDYMSLFTPNIPFAGDRFKRKEQLFLGLHDRTPLLLTLLMGK